MEDSVKYGQLRSEKTAEENEVCRKIVKEISQFGISERQRMFLIYLLALEVEDADVMRELTACVKELTDSNIFLSGEQTPKIEGTLWEDLQQQSPQSQSDHETHLKSMNRS